LNRAQRSGAAFMTQMLATELGVATTVIDEHMELLAASGFVAHTQAGSWVLAWNPETATLRDLYDALHLPFAGSWLGKATLPWQRQIEPAIRRVVKAEAAAAQMTIASLIADVKPGAGTNQGPVRPGGRQRSTKEIAAEIGSR